MKNLYFIVAGGMFLLTSTGADAQVSSTAIKFIDNIQITPGTHSGQNNADINRNSSKEIAAEVVQPTITNTIENCTAIQFKYALMLDTAVEYISNLKLYNFIDGWMDTRYRYGGTGRDGIDCSAFADTLMHNVYGLNIPRTAREQYDACKRIAKDELQQGDLVFFNTRGGVSHVGVYLGNGYFVHSSIHGVIINNLSDDYYNRKYIGGGRWPQINIPHTL